MEGRRRSVSQPRRLGRVPAGAARGGGAVRGGGRPHVLPAPRDHRGGGVGPLRARSRGFTRTRDRAALRRRRRAGRRLVAIEGARLLCASGRPGSARSGGPRRARAGDRGDCFGTPGRRPRPLASPGLERESARGSRGARWAAGSVRLRAGGSLRRAAADLAARRGDRSGALSRRVARREPRPLLSRSRRDAIGGDAGSECPAPHARCGGGGRAAGRAAAARCRIRRGSHPHVPRREGARLPARVSDAAAQGFGAPAWPRGRCGLE